MIIFPLGAHMSGAELNDLQGALQQEQIVRRFLLPDDAEEPREHSHTARVGRRGPVAAFGGMHGSTEPTLLPTSIDQIIVQRIRY